jgi:hypothetical protein
MVPKSIVEPHTPPIYSQLEASMRYPEFRMDGKPHSHQ